jgi:hypothetical protein
VVCANANFFAEKSFSKWRSALAEVFPKYPVSSAAGIGKTNHFGFIHQETNPLCKNQIVQIKIQYAWHLW